MRARMSPRRSIPRRVPISEMIPVNMSRPFPPACRPAGLPAQMSWKWENYKPRFRIPLVAPPERRNTHGPWSPDRPRLRDFCALRRPCTAAPWQQSGLRRGAGARRGGISSLPMYPFGYNTTEADKNQVEESEQ
ncbi:hypothetical protein GCM10011324_00170 [Allosediminivita pacifica]|nr:hypothetical protein GCM10011324_00170 [Allosediminivita pacifica]